MKLSCTLLLVALVGVLFCAPAAAQFSRRRSPRSTPDLPFSIGGYIQFGAQSPTPPDSTQGFVATIGLYGELNPKRLAYLHPGLDLRGTSAGNGCVGGTLVGPRLGVSYSVLHPYVEALFGPNHIVPSQQNYEGITSSFVAGLDLDYGTNVRWRVLEYSQGHFSGVPNSNPRTISTGFTIVFP